MGKFFKDLFKPRKRFYSKRKSYSVGQIKRIIIPPGGLSFGSANDIELHEAIIDDAVKLARRGYLYKLNLAKKGYIYRPNRRMKGGGLF